MILVEPLSRKESDSINSCREAVELIQFCGHPNFRLHVDLRSAFDENENQDEIWGRYKDYIKHCHVANPGFAPPGPDCLKHTEAAQAMKRAEYSGYISIEIGRCNDPGIIERSIRFVRDTYCS